MLLAFIVGIVIIGGIKRIGKVTGYLAPFMAAIYVFAAILILLSNMDKLGGSFGLIFEMAFNPPAEIAGTVSGSFLVMLNTMLWGIKRGLYSNEAGQGSAQLLILQLKQNTRLEKVLLQCLDHLLIQL